METETLATMEIDEEEEDEDERRGIATILLHSAPYPFPQKMNFPELSRHYSCIAWCGRSNIIACATETCAKDPRCNSQPAFWVPVHIVDPERPTEHSLFNVTADSQGDILQFLEWSPISCPQALLVGNSGGRVTIWSQPTQGGPNVARSLNCWSCECEWRQDEAVVTKWLTGVSPYRWSPTVSTSSSNTKSSFEEKFLAHQARASVRWPNFMCICSVLSSGCVQLHWRQWPSQSNSPSKWHSTNKTLLGAGPSGVFTADVIVTDSGSVLVAGAPVGSPSTVVVWEITPCVNSTGSSQQGAKYNISLQSPSSFCPPSWSGMAPLATYLISWQEYSGVEGKPGQMHTEDDEKVGPVLQCVPVSNLSAYVTPDAKTSTCWGSGITALVFDPSRGGAALITLICEGFFLSPELPDDGVSVTGWKFQRWESSRQQVPIHSMFESGNTSYAAQPMVTTWTPVISRSVNISPKGGACGTPGKHSMGSLVSVDAKPFEQRCKSEFVKMDRPSNLRCVARVIFSGHGGEFAISVATGEVLVFSGSAVAPIENFNVRVGLVQPPCMAFSPNSCCLASVWHDKKADCSLLKVYCLDPPIISTTQGATSSTFTWERHIADRLWWSLVNDLDWWDIVVCTQYCAEDGAVFIGKVTAVLDADFHGLPTAVHRQHYSSALDRVKCRMLEGIDSADVRALVLDMQARLLLEMLGKGIEAALLNPSTLVTEPWLASSESLSGLGVDAMVVDPALVQSIQAYVDAVLDLASHFLTRLRRYASFCRTLATHAAGNQSSGNTNNRPSATSNSGPLTSPSGQASGAQSGTASNGGTAQVQAWVQGAIAKISSNAEGVPSNSSSTGAGPASPLPLSVSTAAFPGIPAVRLIGDCHFLHRLCHLLFFCLIFRKRQLPRFVGASRMSTEAPTGAKGVAGTVTPKTEDLTTNSATSRGLAGGPVVKMEDGSRTLPTTKVPEEPPNTRAARVGSGNAGQGYTSDEVKFLFLVLVDLCKRTSTHAHPMPKSQVGQNSPATRLHYIDGQYTVSPEVVEASLGPHMQSLPRPRGADAAGLLMRELELHPPAEEWHRRTLSWGPWTSTLYQSVEMYHEDDLQSLELWPRKRRFAERDAAFGIRTAIGLGSFAGFVGSRRDVVTCLWKTSQHGSWNKCMRCGRQTASLLAPTLSNSSSSGTHSQAPTATGKEAWWAGRWAFCCPMCGGRWNRML